MKRKIIIGVGIIIIGIGASRLPVQELRDYFTINSGSITITSTVADGATNVAFLLNSSNLLTSNLVEVRNTNILEGWITYNGITASTNGFASGATDAAVTGATTGWTNTFGKLATVRITGTNVTYTVFNGAGTALYTNLTTAGVLNGYEILQASGKVIVSGTAVFVRGTPL